MKHVKPIVLLLLLLVFATAFSGCSRQVLAEPIKVSDRQTAPTFMLKDLFSGDDVEFGSDSGGRVRMVNFFSPG